VKLRNLLRGVNPLSCNIASDIEITHICAHSDECKAGSLFFAMRGDKNDGNNYVNDALAKGAAAILTEYPQQEGVPYILVQNIRAVIGIVAANYYGNPHRKLKIISVLGTNGKTTTANMIGYVLNFCGKKAAIIGTLGAEISGRELPCNLTTPDPIDMHRLFREALDAGCEYVVMEVSAHAVHYQKTYGIVAEAAVFTNLSQDHLDFFGTMERYAATKYSYFEGKNAKTAILNVDDAFGLKMSREIRMPVKTYGIQNPSDVFAIDIAHHPNGTSCIVNAEDEIFELKTKYIGEFNVYNCLAAIGCLIALGIPTDRIAHAFLKMEPVRGRFNVMGGNKKVVIDFAHTPDGLKNLLKAARGICKGKLIAVFGCGGNRDTKKRAIMGRIAAEYADFTVITSDNSRDENPADIISEIEQGFREVSLDYITIIDREHAINYALHYASASDLVVIAGKGGEEYMEEKGIKRPYSDKKVVEDLLRRYSL
jgi:UDP-N-acetylmuramoyl-L-alanyl-D-glutamate--2,6-diaminopimelate ligase